MFVSLNIALVILFCISSREIARVLNFSRNDEMFLNSILF